MKNGEHELIVKRMRLLTTQMREGFALRLPELCARGEGYLEAACEMGHITYDQYCAGCNWLKLEARHDNNAMSAGLHFVGVLEGRE